MKLVMTLLARDEADIVDAQLAFHLGTGIDFVVATDNGSTDGTTEILERYAQAGVLHLIREPGDAMLQSQWVTRMARLAASDFGANWVINADADEFWWPRSGSLKDVFATIPARFSIVRGAWRHFLPRPEDEGEDDVLDRMTVRLRRPAFPGDKTTIYHAHQKVAHRARPDAVVDDGNHDVDAAGGLAPLRGWYPLEVLHFSFRSRTQLEQKATRAYEAWLRNPRAEPTLHQALAYEACRSGTLDEYYGAFVVDDRALERGLRDGTLAVDTRLRDALRILHLAEGSFPPDAAGSGLSFPAPSLREEVEFLEEIAPLLEIDGVVRVERRVDALEERLGALEGARLSGRRLAPR